MLASEENKVNKGSHHWANQKNNYQVVSDKQNFVGDAGFVEDPGQLEVGPGGEDVAALGFDEGLDVDNAVRRVHTLVDPRTCTELKRFVDKFDFCGI